MMSALFRDRESAEQAYCVLCDLGYGRDEIAVLMSDASRARYFSAADHQTEFGSRAWEGAGIGAAIGGGGGATLAAVAAIGTSVALPGLSLVVAGPLAAALAGAGAGGLTGGLVGALVGSGIPEETAGIYDEGVRQGGIVLSFEPRSSEEASLIESEWERAGAKAIQGKRQGTTAASQSEYGGTGSFDRDYYYESPHGYKGQIKESRRDEDAAPSQATKSIGGAKGRSRGGSAMGRSRGVGGASRGGRSRSSANALRDEISSGTGSTTKGVRDSAFAFNDIGDLAEGAGGSTSGGSPTARGGTGRGGAAKKSAKRPGKTRARGSDKSPARARGRGAQQKATYHFRAEMESQVVVQRAATIEVTLAREELGLATGAAAKEGKFAADPQKKLIIQVVPKTNFEVIESDRVEIDLQASEESEWPQSFYFYVRPTQTGEGEVWVMARQGQVSLALLKLSLQIVKARSRAAKPKAVAEGSAADAPALAEPLHQLHIHEQRDGDRVWFMYELQSPALDILEKYHSEPLETDRQLYVEKLYKQIENFWLSNKDDAQNFARVLRARGGELFDELIPEKLQRRLWQNRDKIRSIMVISAEPFIPWELMFLKDPDQQRMPDDTKSLGQMGLVRWLHEAGWPPPQLKIRQGRALYVIPDYPLEELKLPEATKESEFLQRHFAAKSLEAKSASVYDAISRPGEFDLLHFACHGYAEQDNISNAGVLLEGRTELVRANGGAELHYIPDPLIAAVVEHDSHLRAKDNRPIVVLNACQTAREGYSLTGIGGFAQAFLMGGAGAFVGTLWSVGDSPARTFTETLYSKLRGKGGRPGLQLADAAIAAREAARKAGDATWLAYAVYGHPHLKITA